MIGATLCLSTSRRNYSDEVIKLKQNNILPSMWICLKYVYLSYVEIIPINFCIRLILFIAILTWYWFFSFNYMYKHLHYNNYHISSAIIPKFFLQCGTYASR